MKIIIVIPAHLNSIRFPKKVLFPFFDVPMIEHVRRRALMNSQNLEVIVATCDQEIADVIESFGGDVVFTNKDHLTGTTRVAEAIEKIECSHVILLQGDEPLIYPTYIDTIVEFIKSKPGIVAWNATAPINNKDELDRHSFVKCSLSPLGKILYYFRRSPSHQKFNYQKQYISKILGIMAFRKEFLLKLVQLEQSKLEKIESVEQFRIIENGLDIYSIPFSESLPSVNEPSEAKIIMDLLQKNDNQKILLEKTIKNSND